MRPSDLSLLLVDPDFLVIDKPPRVLAAPGRGDEPNAPDLLRQRRELADNPSIRIVHRLDRDATGVQLYARTLRGQQSLVRQFAGRSVEKVYFALVTGYVEADGEVNHPLAVDKHGERVTVSTSNRAKDAVTRYRIVQRLAGNTLLECRPLTGRMHQIRAHMAAVGHPLTVDPLYGGGQVVLLSHYKSNYRASRRHPEQPLIERLTLHAARLTFTHPATGERVTVEAPLPKDFRATINQLGRALPG